MNTPSECGYGIYGHEGRAIERGTWPWPCPWETEGRDSWVWVVIGGIGDSDHAVNGKRNRRARDVARERRE